MNIAQLLPLLIVVPFVGFLISLLIPRKREGLIFSVAIASIFIELAALGALIFQWATHDFAPLLANSTSLYSSPEYRFDLDFYFDRLTAVFMGMATVMTSLVLVFSKYYMHREQGFKRFYTTILLFFTGLSIVILAGNFEVLFVGWELIGISSVLLIAFYRDRFLPARNALKVFSLYRLADVFILAAIWYAHHMFEKNLNFSELSALAVQHGDGLMVLGLLLLVAAAIKSAQFPFSYWLPRAMEGPTTSSAIFYGALSVHMGLFLMLRTYPLWEGSMWLRVVIALVGLATALIASSIAHVQSSIKTQIAYASVTQIGIMFIELSLGLHWLVLLHFVSNASLRTYQLLISPSVVSYLVHDQFFYFVPPVHKIRNNLLGKLRASLYILSVKEWNMNTGFNHYFWRPIKTLGRNIAWLDKLSSQLAGLVLFVIIASILATTTLSTAWTLTVSTASAILSLALYIRSFSTKASARIGWNLILLGHLYGALFLGMAAGGAWGVSLLYGAGVAASYMFGSLILGNLEDNDELGSLRNFNGSIYRFAGLGNLFFVVCLLFMAFPISPSFLAQDILLGKIPEEHVFQIVFFCLSYLISGVAIMRLYIKTFFGPHKSSHHEHALKAS